MKKKIIIALAVLVCAAVIAAGIGFKIYKKANTPVEYQLQSFAGTELSGNTDIKLIAHRGYRAIAPENTLPAFQRAGEAGFWGAECDIYRTTDGIWVLMHDDTVNRMTDGKGKIQEKSYDELKELTIDNGNSVDTYPNTKIPTLEEYITECKSTGMTAVIEIKDENETEHLGEIVDMVKKQKADAVYISFNTDNLKAIRKLDEKAQLFYLVNEVNDDVINIAKEIGNCGIDFNAGVTDNLKDDGAAIKKIGEAGLTAAAWTVDDIETVKTLAGYGVNYITTDCITY